MDDQRRAQGLPCARGVGRSVELEPGGVAFPLFVAGSVGGTTVRDRPLSDAWQARDRFSPRPSPPCASLAMDPRSTCATPR